MIASSDEELRTRLRICLQTILEMEPQLASIELKDYLADEFSVLKEFIGKLDNVPLSEDDVKRVEEATMDFLAELEDPLRMRGENTDVTGPVH